jgi:tetratricopeptide (TPR) repeat protein
LLESLKIDAEQLHPRTELSKIYQRQKKWREAEDILLESLKIDAEQLHPRTELSKIYQRQKKWREAEDILLELKNLDPENLQARTELSKIYQQQRKWREAEDILLECLEIYPDDPNSQLELGKICSKDPRRYSEAEKYFSRLLELDSDDYFAKLELALLYRKVKRYPAYERMLLSIYKDHPESVPTLAGLARMFMRFKKYRIAIKLFDEILEIKNSDMKAIIELIYIYAYLQDKASVGFYMKKGENLIKQDSFIKYRDRFETLHINLNEDINLLNLSAVGIYTQADDQKYVRCSNERFALGENATINNKVKSGDKVFFASYAKQGQTFADFVEPYFESIVDLEKLK